MAEVRRRERRRLPPEGDEICGVRGTMRSSEEEMR